MASPVVIGSERSEAGLPAAAAILEAGGSALDAVEAALRVCEDNLADHYVGTGGLPNAAGVVELDASVMVGSSRRFGAVAALQGYPHPISVARAVLERLPQHCLLVGEGAARFADECGFERAELLTQDSRALWSEVLATSRPVEGVHDEVTAGDALYRARALELVARLAPHDGPWGTIDVIALDATGEIVSGVSTSGYPWKYPGRVGDSALPGAGNYADVRYGAAAATGRGEMAMRVALAHRVVTSLSTGAAPLDACVDALDEARGIPDDYAASLRVLCLTPDGGHAGAATTPGATYAVMRPGDSEATLLERACL